MVSGNDPRGALRCALGNFLHGESLDRRGYLRLLLFVNLGDRIRRGLHPATFVGTRDCRVLEAQAEFVVGFLRMNLDLEVAVVTDTHEIPGDLCGLDIVRLIPRSSHRHIAQTSK
eukprot:Plantae.Rhodophyta-Rhodochaete_pulchella.ctg46098.p2 GENE.Plantae.Rhodophyta-Rhodochaete_pulchella.ctg46098~~Plantae.Rhodophyta-Rhodochaete_pulchella.ctg46098.p2  ORF type:complete len:115 (+),score=11.56 Plantae.Rhodophyta-Rhodochaete_pulchella.ctg46098:247-591(+)